MNKIHLSLATLLAVLGALIAPVYAQPALELVDPDGFTERFSGDAQVSGQFLTGLAFINASTTFDLGQVRVVYPERGGNGRLCVRLTSDDGRYWAANLYQAAQAAEGYPTVPLPTAYSDHLARYGYEGLLFMASESRDCQSTAGQTLLPAVVGPPADDASLFAFVNVSQGRVSSWLEDESGNTTDPTACKQPATGIKVTYSHQCALPVTLGSNSKPQKLVVSVRSLTGATSEQSYAVYMD